MELVEDLQQALAAPALHGAVTDLELSEVILENLLENLLENHRKMLGEWDLMGFIASGQRLHNELENHHVLWVNPLFLWSFSSRKLLGIARG